MWSEEVVKFTLEQHKRWAELSAEHLIKDVNSFNSWTITSSISAVADLKRELAIIEILEEVLEIPNGQRFSLYAKAGKVHVW